MTSDTAEIAAILSAALDKYRTGAQKYGEFVPETDNRDLIHEAEAEILDAINYLAMMLIRVRRLQKIPGVADSLPGRLRDERDCDVRSTNVVINSK